MATKKEVLNMIKAINTINNLKEKIEGLRSDINELIQLLTTNPLSPRISNIFSKLNSKQIIAIFNLLPLHTVEKLLSVLPQEQLKRAHEIVNSSEF